MSDDKTDHDEAMKLFWAAIKEADERNKQFFEIADREAGRNPLDPNSYSSRYLRPTFKDRIKGLFSRIKKSRS